MKLPLVAIHVTPFPVVAIPGHQYAIIPAIDGPVGQIGIVRDDQIVAVIAGELVRPDPAGKHIVGTAAPDGIRALAAAAPHPTRAYARGIVRSPHKGPHVRWQAKAPQPARWRGPTRGVVIMASRPGP